MNDCGDGWKAPHWRAVLSESSKLWGMSKEARKPLRASRVCRAYVQSLPTLARAPSFLPPYRGSGTRRLPLCTGEGPPSHPPHCVVGGARPVAPSARVATGGVTRGANPSVPALRPCEGPGSGRRPPPSPRPSPSRAYHLLAWRAGGD